MVEDAAPASKLDRRSGALWDGHAAAKSFLALNGDNPLETLVPA
jgi:hypothetical protein